MGEAAAPDRLGDPAAAREEQAATKAAVARRVEEAEAIRRMTVSYPVAVIDNGVDTEYFRSRSVERSPEELVPI